MILDETGVLENGQLAEPAYSENNRDGDVTTRLTFDIETYFDESYSLRNKKLPTEVYILDERFEMLALAYAFDDGPIHSVLGHEAIANRSSRVRRRTAHTSEKLVGSQRSQRGFGVDDGSSMRDEGDHPRAPHRGRRARMVEAQAVQEATQ